ncbi:MAG: hypothetical protein RL199_1211 [Pseudomonadota bacterium]|jgi:hypothetical protein
MRIVESTRGARLVHDGHTVSFLPARPGTTGSIFDVLAALVARLAPPKTAVAMLGFAAGGTVAPLRALGVTGRVEAADLSTDAVPTFHRIARDWAGEVAVTEAEASRWLRSRRLRYGALIDDLSMQIPGDVTKPEVSWTTLPPLMAARRRVDGVSIHNLLPVAGMSWRTLIGHVTRDQPAAVEVRSSDYDNRIVVAGRSLPEARTLGRTLDALLAPIDSPLAGTLSLRTLSRP